MIDYFASNMWQVWAIVAVVCLILELSSGDLFIICFSVGGIIAAIGAAIGLNIYWQLLIFAVCSLLSIFFIRPVALKWLHRNDEQRVSNADALLGRTGRVSQEIPTGGSGYVQIDGDQWKAVTADGTAIAAGQAVKVTDRKSTIVTVETL